MSRHMQDDIDIKGLHIGHTSSRQLGYMFYLLRLTAWDKCVRSNDYFE